MPGSENSNILRRCLEPLFLINAVFYWTKKVTMVLMKKVDALLKTRLYLFFHYPVYLNTNMRQSGEIADYKDGYLSQFSGSETYGLTTAEHEEGKDVSRTGKLNINIDQLPDWSRVYEDREDTFALHRWGWLLMLAVKAPSVYTKSRGIEIMKDWFIKMGKSREGHAWESYSVSERIASALMFFYAFRNVEAGLSEDIRFIEKKLFEMAGYLAENLEYHGSHTNNHVLNNARALYILGRISDCGTIAGIGRKIFMEETPEMITASGFLREDSSSYHLLLLRTYLEVLWAAEYSGDEEFVKFIRPFACSMVKAAWLFNMSTGDCDSRVMPLIGDVTPDFPVAWTRDICRSGPALQLYRPAECKGELRSGWNCIWEPCTEPALPSEKPGQGKYLFRSYEDSGWYRLDYGEIVLLLHACPSGPIPLYSHGHNDIFSFVLYWKGCPLIIDPGRFSYLPAPFGTYGKSSSAHNTVTVDGFDSYPLNRGIYPTKYRKGNAEVMWENRTDGFYFKVSHDGFSRIDESIIAYRDLFITKDSIRIRDSVNGKGPHSIKTFYHFDECVKVSAADSGTMPGLKLDIEGKSVDFRMKTEGFNPDVRLINGQKGPHPAGWYFPEYGKALPVTTCVIETSKELPYHAEYKMELPE